MAVAAEGEGSLLNSATWAIALTCFMFIAISIFFEKAIELAEHLLVKYKQISLQAAFHRIKDELMLVGFISIALTVGQSSVAKICVPTSAALAMPLCKIDENAAATTSECSEGHTPFIPAAGFHKLHIFIFILALVHILYSLLIVALGMWSVSFWNAWERLAVLNKEDSSIGGDIRLAKDTTFVRSRLPIPAGWMRKPIIPYVVAFFRQFFHPVSETDYITLRNGFIMSHTPGHLSFNFHKYIRRSLQDDFQHVVGISPALWLFACIWLLVNVEGWETKLWTAFIALLLVLIVGTKLQFVITSMALRYQQAHALTLGVPNIKPSDDLFWFNRTRFTLWCIHFILFQNALDVSFVLWIAFSFSGENCVNQEKYKLIVRLIVGFASQVILGLVTLPSYAIVSQMGTKLKRSMFEKNIQAAIIQWHQRAKENIHHESDGFLRDHHQNQDPGQSYSPPVSHVEMTSRV
ncbi:hypothetical protein GOP47_0014812 [Adiantum capillus-veneris]|uniref:MLO-like protein n=1 Tax=Adiantum capillus-veneris TaxID=13818 RepID=A0A9D4UMT0_ADICA|nr:hypothetical protein GOP47_0014812 [Adiantum capillus-veneris]